MAYYDYFGWPAYVSVASHFSRDGSRHGLPDVKDLRDHNAIQGHFRFAA